MKEQLKKPTGVVDAIKLMLTILYVDTRQFKIVVVDEEKHCIVHQHDVERGEVGPLEDKVVEIDLIEHLKFASELKAGVKYSLLLTAIDKKEKGADSPETEIAFTLTNEQAANAVRRLYAKQYKDIVIRIENLEGNFKNVPDLKEAVKEFKKLLASGKATIETTQQNMEGLIDQLEIAHKKAEAFSGNVEHVKQVQTQVEALLSEMPEAKRNPVHESPSTGTKTPTPAKSHASDRPVVESILAFSKACIAYILLAFVIIAVAISICVVSVTHTFKSSFVYNNDANNVAAGNPHPSTSYPQALLAAPGTNVTVNTDIVSNTVVDGTQTQTVTTTPSQWVNDGLPGVKEGDLTLAPGQRMIIPVPRGWVVIPIPSDPYEVYTKTDTNDVSINRDKPNIIITKGFVIGSVDNDYPQKVHLKQVPAMRDQ